MERADQDANNRRWEVIGSRISRAAVPGGWLVLYGEYNHDVSGLTFVPDPQHQWDGKFLDPADYRPSF